MILLYFKFTRSLVFTTRPTVMLNIGDSSIRCLEKNTDVHQQIQTLIVKTDHMANNFVQSAVRCVGSHIINKSSKNIRNYHKATKKYYFTHT